MSDSNKPWEVFYKPVPKGKEFELDIVGLLDSFTTDGMKDDKGNIDFIAGAMVIQGATHAHLRNVDKLHEETTEAVKRLTMDDENDVGEDNSGGNKRSRKKKKSWYQRHFDGENGPDQLATEDEISMKFGSQQGQVVIPPPHPFFRDPVGEERGHELTDVNTGDYVAHSGDLWCHRVKFTPNGLLLPGQSRNDPGLLTLRRTARFDHQSPGISSNPSVPCPRRIHDESMPTPNINHSGDFSDDIQDDYDMPDQEMPPSDHREQSSFVSSRQTNHHQDNSFGPDCSEPWCPLLIPEELMNDDDPRNEYLDDDDVQLRDDRCFDENLEIMEDPSFEQRLEVPKNRYLDINSTTQKLKFNPKYYFESVYDETPEEQEKSLRRPEQTRERYEKAAIAAWWNPYFEFHRRKRRERNKKNIALYNKRVREYMLKVGNPRRYHKIADDEGKNVHEVIAEEIGTNSQSAGDIPKNLYQGLVTDDAVPEFDNGPDDNFQIPDDNPIYEDPPEDINFGIGEEVSSDMPANDLIVMARQHLDRLQSQYRDNEIQARVREWTKRILPILDQENSREPFNIRKTINRIDGAIECNQEYTWSGLMQRTASLHDLEDHEYCHYFAAMLQMANEGKIKIMNPDSMADPASPNYQSGIFTIVKIPDADREEVAGDDVEIDDEFDPNDSKRPRSDTTNSEKEAIPKPPSKKIRGLTAKN